jgi:protein involved in polysaccharide export with SLBB domain
MKRIALLWLLAAAGALAQTERDKETPSTSINTGVTIGVTVGGAFPLNGTYEASPLERVDQFVTRLMLLLRPRPEMQQDLGADAANRMTDLFARRAIRLIRTSGGELSLDLERFRLTGDFKHNPYLKNDDVLIFPPIDKDRDFISITGAVSRPIRFQYVDGDRLSDALLFAGGLKVSADSTGCAEISRLDLSGERETVIDVLFRENPELKRGDRITVRTSENERRDYRVYVSGEVNTPGSIPISRSSTTLREVVSRAGGFKPTADLARAELIRGANVFQSLLFTNEFERMLMTRMAVISSEDTLSFSIDNTLRVSRGNGIIDFARVLEDSSLEGDFIVRDNDFVFVPEMVELVYVYGQVNTPGYVQYRPGERAEYYLTRAGGVAESAKGTIYLIKGKSRSWAEIADARAAAVEPGDFLWAPKRLPRDFDYYLLRIGSVASVIAALSTVMLLILQY